jgi:hypothetical protein
MFKLTKFEFQYAIRINYCSYTLPRLAGREIRKSELQVQFITIASSKQGNLKEYCYPLTSFVHHHAPCAWLCSEKRQSLLFSTHLFAKGASQIKVHCHPPRSTPRSARRFAASNDSPFYSTRFLRLGGRAPTRREEAKICKKKENLGVPNGA